MLLIIIASFTKSAQFPFSSWLPVAIAAPTPVSSLVHSSTLVTAGVYLLIRFNYLIYKNSELLLLILFIRIITIIFSGFSANFEYDVKKIIAYSTLSQLGLIMAIYSMKNFELTFFHLVIHAIFKSIIFICSGVFIHYLSLYQDIRYMGNLKIFIPLTCIIFIISNYSLCGIPFISGFFSKDQILEFIFIRNLNLIIYIIIMLSTGLTVSYSVRLIYYLISREFNFNRTYLIIDNKLMNYSIFILIMITIFSGFFLN